MHNPPARRTVRAVRALALTACAVAILTLVACGGGSSSLKAGDSQRIVAATQKVSGMLSIHDRDWIHLIPGTTWNRCNGQGCDGQECYGTGPANGLESGAEVLVTNGLGDKVALGEVGKSWGWKRGSRGVCVLYWSVKVPVDQSGVLTAMFAGNSHWAPNFTLARMRRLPHALDFIGIG